MNKKYLSLPLIIVTSMIVTACSKKNSGPLEIELDEYTPVAYINEQYDFTDVLYVEDGVDYKLEVYYQNYNTLEEFSLPVVDTFYFTPVELYDLTVIVNATKGKLSAKRIRHVEVSSKPEENTRYNIEMCNFENGVYRGTGSAAEISYTDTFGNSRTSRKITFKNSLDLPDEVSCDSDKTVNASFNLATTPNLGTTAGIDSKICIFSFDIKMSDEFYNSINNYKNLFVLKIEDDKWIPHSATLSLTDNISTFNKDNTTNGWFHVEHNLYDVDDLGALGLGTYVVTLGFFGIANNTRDSAYVILDNISLRDIPEEQRGDREVPTRSNIEMCRFEPGAFRGTGSKSETSYTELWGPTSTSSRVVTFVNSEGLPSEVDDENFATVNASFNLANTWSIGVDNGIDANNCILSFDLKLSEEFFDTTHQYKHLFLLKIEDETWVPSLTWISMVNNVSEFTYDQTDNGWKHIEVDLSLNPELAELGDDTFVVTFGFFGLTTTTCKTARLVFDNIALSDKI